MGDIYGRTNSYAIGLLMLTAAAAATLIMTLTVVRSTAQKAELEHAEAKAAAA
jgi:NNP family nitrate/nitrite transporter-like MFS transporter